MSIGEYEVLVIDKYERVRKKFLAQICILFSAFS